MNPARRLLLSCLLGACHEATATGEFTGRRAASQPSSPVLAGATIEQRFPVQNVMAKAQQRETQPSDDLLDYDLPRGWKLLPPTKDRLVNFAPAGDPEASCYLSFLPGSGGGLVENVNRWRKQLGAGPLEADEVAALPTHALLGREGSIVEAEGTFAGMGATAPRAGFALLGIVVSEPDGSLFLKLTAPAGIVKLERERFFALAKSLRLSDAHGASASVAPDAPAPASMTWNAPSGWTQAPPRAMREVTFTVGAGGECYVARLLGSAGGLRGNLDRWRGQIGREALTDAEFEALERVLMLGQEVPVLSEEGTISGMDGKPLPDQALLRVACIRDHDSLFVKFTGPAELVRAEHANFLAFVRSLREAP